MKLPPRRLPLNLRAGFVGVTLLATTVFAAERGLDWPQFRGPNGQGTSSATGLPTTWSSDENVVWKAELPGAGTSSPIIVGSRVYLTCYSGFNVPPGRPSGDMQQLKLHLVCLDRASGRVLWNSAVAPKLPEQEKIRDDHGYASSTPASDGERLYVYFGKTGAMAFDMTGEKLWQTDVGSNLHGWGSATSPVLFENLVFINASVESESLYALDKKTGREVWRVRGIRESWNTPILVPVAGGTTELVVAILGKVLGLDPATGKQLWSCNTDIGWYMVPSMVAKAGIVYCIGGRSGGGLAVKAGGRGDVTESHRLWASRKGSNVSSPVLHEGHLYWMHEGLGIAYCAEAKTGKIVYEERVDRADQIYASPVLADGKLYYVSRSGRTFVVAAKPEFERLAVNEFDRSDRATFNASPAVADGRLFLRSDRFLYSLGTR